jgi:hypothetical protein
MIARYFFLLPYTFSLKNGSSFPFQEFKREKYTIRLLPPQQCKVDITQFDVAKGASVDELADQIRPAQLLEANNHVLLDGLPSINANLILVEFHGEKFRRSKDTIDFTDIDPPITEALEIANLFLIRYRSLVRDSGITPISIEDVIWRLDYLNDDGNLVPRDPTNEMVNRLQGTPGSFVCHGLDRALWNAIFALNEAYYPPAWYMLLLDGENQLPDINAAIVLVAAALETFISETLQSLAGRSSLPQDLWKWINERDFWLKNPSTVDQFDVLLKVFTGYSLKDDKQLWDSYINLRTARNKIAHSGKASIGGKEVTPAKAKDLIGVAHAVINRVEEHIPSDLRAPRFESALRVGLRMRMKIDPTIAHSELQVKPVVPESKK